MADNRVAYGLAKKYGIDTAGMSPKEVWEALKGKGVTEHNVADGAYDSKANKAKDLSRKVTKKEMSIVDLPDENLPKSVGARWANEEIKMPDGSISKFVEGSKITHKQVFAGKGCKRKIDCVDWLVSKYGGKESEWQKVKGIADIVTNQGEEIRCEIHWYEEPGVGRVEIKKKKEI